MRIKYGQIFVVVFVVTIVVIFVLMFLFQNDKDEIIIKQQVVTKTMTVKPSNKIDIKTVPKPIIKKQAITQVTTLQPEPSAEQSEYEQPIDIIYRELSVERYSQEPALELISVVREMTDCGYIKSYQRYKFIKNKNQLSATQQKTYEKYQDACIKISDTYPRLIEYNQSQSQSSQSRKQDFLWVMMNSPYRELVISSKTFKKQDASAQTQFIFSLTKAILNSQNSQMLLFLSTILTEDVQFLNALKLPQALSSINTAYVQMIVGQAAVLMSCDYDNGISCAASSYYMTVICFENESACGMDVKSWFKYNHSFSHNQDINKIIRYFQSMSET